MEASAFNYNLTGETVIMSLFDHPFMFSAMPDQEDMGGGDDDS